MVRNTKPWRLLICAEAGWPGCFMSSAVSDLLVVAIKLAAVQMRFGLIAAEVAALSFGQMTDRSEVGAEKRPQPFNDAEIDAAARVINDKLLGRRDGGFQNLLRLNFPDDEILAMAEAALSAARAAK
jgi:hypothetical protein